MTHSVILNNFSLPWLVRAIEEELGKLVFMAKCYRNLTTPEQELAYILERFIPLRWRYVFDAKDASEQYKYQVYITIAVFLNKYGYQDEYITQKAITGLKMFKENAFGMMPSHQYKKAEKAMLFLKETVAYHTKKPGYKATITQYRAGDVLAIKIGEVYAVAVVVAIQCINETPVLEVYKGTFTTKPSLTDLSNLGPVVEAHYMVGNLNYLPDMAHQISCIGSIAVDFKFKGGPYYEVFEFLEMLYKSNKIDVDLTA